VVTRCEQRQPRETLSRDISLVFGLAAQLVHLLEGQERPTIGVGNAERLSAPVEVDARARTGVAVVGAAFATQQNLPARV
jgi:hypothetical protein